MEIRVTRHLTGEALLAGIIAAYGSLESLKSEAGKKGSHQAQEDWLTASDILASAKRRSEKWEQSTSYRLKPAEMKLLTPARLEILEWLHKTRRKDVNVRELAKRLRRDKKNVSKDLQILKQLHLVELHREGREAFPMATGGRITIDFEQPA